MSRTTCFHRRPLRAVVLAVSVLAVGLATPALAQDTDPPVIRVLESGVEIVDGVLFDGVVTLVIETTDASPPVDGVATLHGDAFTSAARSRTRGCTSSPSPPPTPPATPPPTRARWCSTRSRPRSRPPTRRRGRWCRTPRSRSRAAPPIPTSTGSRSTAGEEDPAEELLATLAEEEEEEDAGGEPGDDDEEDG